MNESSSTFSSISKQVIILTTFFATTWSVKQEYEGPFLSDVKSASNKHTLGSHLITQQFNRFDSKERNFWLYSET